MLKKIGIHWVPIIRSILIAMGFLWLPIEAYEGLENTDAKLPYSYFLFSSFVLGIIFFLVDGHLLTGFLKNQVDIKNNGFDTKISIIFGDLFAQNGWKAISVNDFFDSIVDDDLVSSKSLHGHVINTHWENDRKGWQDEINSSLKDELSEKEARGKGNKKRYPIGTTANSNARKMLFVALGKTGTVDNVTTASAESLICAVRGLLKKARVVCANDQLNIPLMGSGLGRVGIKNNILVDLILAAVFEETKQAKITSSITIVLPIESKSEINLGNYDKNWN